MGVIGLIPVQFFAWLVITVMLTSLAFVVHKILVLRAAEAKLISRISEETDPKIFEWSEHMLTLFSVDGVSPRDLEWSVGQFEQVAVNLEPLFQNALIAALRQPTFSGRLSYVMKLASRTVRFPENWTPPIQRVDPDITVNFYEGKVIRTINETQILPAESPESSPRRSKR
jgi:hypothetical protein